MAIPYQSANILVIAIWGSTTKFNSRQYFRLYGTIILCMSNLLEINVVKANILLHGPINYLIFQFFAIKMLNYAETDQ